MLQRKTLYLVDSDTHRRAAMCHTLASADIYVEPYDSIEEIKIHWPRNGAILVEDCDDYIPHLLEFMAASHQWLPLIAFAEDPSAPQVARAILTGALGYFAWPASPQDIEEAVDRAEADSALLGSFRLRQARARSQLQKLTRREQQVLSAITEGLSNREIGERLAISPRTVEIHRSNMLNKVGASHTSEAIRISIEATLVT
jgi:FixJ family two-component response regulator